jgi:hypothetical protein
MRVAVSCALLALSTALGGWTAAPLGTPTRAVETPDGVWSRVTGYGGYFRDVIELRVDGTYTSGLCSVQQMGWCNAGQATASLAGRWTLSGEAISVDHGAVNMDHHGAASVDRAESFRWRVVWDEPDSPPTGRKPLRRLYLTYPNGEQIMFNEAPADHRPRWTPRADR